VKGNAYLQDSLVQPPHRTSLAAPEDFERLMLLEILTTIELLDGVEQELRRRLLAPVHD